MGKEYGYDEVAFEVKYTYYQDDLGASYQKGETTFKLWSPLALKVETVLYEDGVAGEVVSVHEMEKSDHGTFKVTLKGDYDKVYYRYRVTFEEGVNEFVDPYARAVGVNGLYAMVIDLEKTNPIGWSSDVKPELKELTDSVIYELHVRDLSIHPSSGIENKGKFLGLTETGTTSYEGLATGLDHLKELGITHVHLLPVYDFGSIDESKLDVPQFNWGYDPLNYNALEGSYSTDPVHGDVRIKEFKEMVLALHRAGIRVIMDVVYNHTHYGEESYLNLAVPSYYHRMDAEGNFSNGSGCGNELASERSMVRRYIVDSVAYFAREFHIDGFRFDLMGLHDVKTMNTIRETLDQIDPSIIMYGEGWTCNPTPLPEYDQALKVNTPKMPRVAAFSDDARDGIKGHVFYEDEGGFVNGGVDFEESIKFAVVGATNHPQVNYDSVMYANEAWASEPNQCVNYVECHDNLTLFDKLEKSVPEVSEENRIKMHKLANGIVFTSQGIAFMHAGAEMLRTKQGVENSYNAPDEINQFDWSRKAKYLEVNNYYKNLIALRKSHPAFRMPSTKMIQNKLMFLNTPKQSVAFMLKEYANKDSWRNIVVVYNANAEAVSINLPMEAKWNVVVDEMYAGTDVIRTITGNKVKVAPLSMYVLYTDEAYMDSTAKMKLGAKIALGVAGTVLVGAMIYKSKQKKNK
ncbi:MAG TPA: type I pullulanase [Firmicutes bacterium]|nr:type I pullulanase [Bacillota bacterium]